MKLPNEQYCEQYRAYRNYVMHTWCPLYYTVYLALAAYKAVRM